MNEFDQPKPEVDEDKERLHRILLADNPIEAARLELIAIGITDFEQQKAPLQRLYMDLESPGRLKRLREMIANGEI